MLIQENFASPLSCFQVSVSQSEEKVKRKSRFNGKHSEKPSPVSVDDGSKWVGLGELLVLTLQSPSSPDYWF